MHAFATLSTIAVILGAVDATCFGGWSLHRNTMKGQIAAACDSGRLQGVFGAGESKSTCVTIQTPASQSSLVLEVRNGNDFTGQIDTTNCKHQLTKLVDNCLVAAGPLAFGGEDNIAGWYFKTDANSGEC